MPQPLKAYLIFGVTIIANALVFTASIYNIEFSERLYRYVISGLYYFTFTLIVRKPGQNNLLTMCLLVAVPSLLIDSTVLLTAPNLVPLRFPFASCFPIVGCLAAYYVLAGRRGLAILLGVLFILFSAISYSFIIPRIIHSAEKVKLATFRSGFLRFSSQMAVRGFLLCWLLIFLYDSVRAIKKNFPNLTGYPYEIVFENKKACSTLRRIQCRSVSAEQTGTRKLFKGNALS